MAATLLTSFPSTQCRSQLLRSNKAPLHRHHPHALVPRHCHPPRITIVAEDARAETGIPFLAPPRPPSRETAEVAPTQTRPSRTRSPDSAESADSSNPLGKPPPPAAPAPRRPSSLFATLCDSWEDMVNNWLEPQPLRPFVDPENVLAGNFVPVPELPPTPCPVVRGSVPDCLRGGAYVRNGPNPQHAPRGPHHLFDGDGMLHSLLLSADGGCSPAVLCSRFVRTHKYNVENEAGAPVFPNFFTFHGLAGAGRGAIFLARVLTGQLNPRQGVSPGNVSLAFFHGRLFALGEPDLPYIVCVSPGDGDVSTVGRSNFDSRVFEGMTAHPKKDPDSGEVFAFRYRPIPPFLTYVRFDEEGKKQSDVPIFSVPRPSLFHDFAITKRYAIFPDIQVVLDYLGMAPRGGPLFRPDPRKVSRIGVIPRYATSGKEMRWFDVPGFNPIHTINAWEEEGDALVLVAPNILGVEHLLEVMERGHCSVEMVRIDLKNNVIIRTPLSARSLDMGVINPAYVGKKNRYAYLAVAGPFPKVKGVAKLDFDLAKQNRDCVVACREYEPGCFGGEPFFVARDDAQDEDDGYLVTYMHNENSGESRFVVLDAKSPGLDVVAEVLLPRRVPYGFHGLFLSKSELRNQGVCATLIGEQEKNKGK